MSMGMRNATAAALIFPFLVIGACLSCVAQNCSGPALRGSFLQPALGDAWTLKQWHDEFGYMKDARLDQMVLQWTADSKEKTTVYPSGVAGYTQNTQHDVVERALAAADASGGQVYLGLQINDDWWTKYITDGTWLKNEAKVANLIADDLWKRYGQHKSLTGWYLGFEVDNVESTAAEWDNLVGFYRTVGNHLHKLTPGKPIVISPFYGTQAGFSPSQWQTMWEYVLKRSPLDVLALQDGVGAGHATRAQLPEWFNAVGSAIQKSRPHMRFWDNAETFVSDYESRPIRSIVNDMCAVRPYVSSYLSFSFNHYISPQQVNPLYYKTYMDYLASGKVEHVRPTMPMDLTSVALDLQTIRLTWAAATDNVGVVGYNIQRNGRHVARQNDGTTTLLDGQLEPGTTYTYQVEAFDAAGNLSALSDATTATTLEPHLYPTNIALGKPYTSTMPANPSYPDTGGVELTDGILGSTDFANPGWQGRATTKPYSFTIDLGAVQAIKEVRSHWLQDEGAAILLPRSVTLLVSDDNVNFATMGMVKKPSPGDDTLPWWYTMTDLASVNGRYVQIQVNPGSNAGWTFIDEIEVRQ